MSRIDWRAAMRAVAARARAGVTAPAATFVLVACGGGGDSAPPAPPPDPPTLTATADATTTVSSGESIALHAAIANGTGTPTWTLDGPGSLSATTGNDVTYVPPDAESFDEAASVTVTVSADAISKQIALTLSAANIAGHHWDLAVAPRGTWTSVASGDGMFVAVGTGGAISASSDGMNWTSHDDLAGHSWRSVAFGSAGWVAVGFPQTLATSPDGQAWTVQPASSLPGVDSTGFGPMTVVFANGIYIVGELGQSWVSSDAVHWTPIAHGFRSIAFGAGMFVGIDGDNLLNTSSDGVHRTVVPNQFDFGSWIAFANGLFVVKEAGQTKTSTDGVTWTPMQVTLASEELFEPLMAIGNTFYVSNVDRYILNGYDYGVGAIGTSTDGTNWTYQREPATAHASAMAANSNAFVVVSTDGSILSGRDAAHLALTTPPSNGAQNFVDFVDGKYIVGVASTADISPNPTNIITSIDGRTWTRIPLDAATPNLWGVFYGSSIAHDSNGVIVIAGSTWISSGSMPVLLRSVDGQTWTNAVVPGLLGTVVSVIHDGTRFVALSSAGIVYSSADALTWTYCGQARALAGQAFGKLVYAAGRYVIVGGGGLAMTSPDTAAWTLRPTVMTLGDKPVALDLAGVVHDGKVFVAIGAQGLVATSSDGASWIVKDSATSEDMNGIAMSPSGELVAVGGHGAVETSVDGTRWTLRTEPSARPLLAVTAANGGFMAVGGGGEIETSTR